jgi:regulatory factor X
MRDLTIRSDPAFGAFQILKLFLDDWVALNVLRSVALSTNSVAASVEPLMQQQFLSLSPMPGQEFTGALDTRPPNPTSLIPDTPTTSSMLAALTQPFGPDSQLDGTTSQFGQNSYMSMSYGGLDNSSSSMGGVSMPFSDFGGPGGAAFDMSSFTQDLNLGTSGGGEGAGSPHSTHSTSNGPTEANSTSNTGNSTEPAVTKEDDSM